jgi:O-methyltransferase involved in polyketide biosynthesis
MPAEHERIGPTAHYTAYVWRRMGLPYADLFATRQGAILYWGFFALGEWTTRVLPRVPSMREYLAYRHLLIDAVVARIEPDLVVEIGAGLTPRTLQWAVDRDVPGVEIDLPAMAALKRRSLARAPAGVRARLRESLRVVDDDVLSEGFAARLRERLQGATRPVVIAEGLVSYFDPAGRTCLFASVASALRGSDGAFLCDLHTREDQARMRGPTRVLRLAIRGLTRRGRALDPFRDRAHVHDALREAGFGESEIVDARDHAAADPRLHQLRSPALIVCARPPAAAKRYSTSSW